MRLMLFIASCMVLVMFTHYIAKVELNFDRAILIGIYATCVAWLIEGN